MKNKKFYIYFTGMISVFSLFVLVVLQFRFYKEFYDWFLFLIRSKTLLIQLKEFGITISGGIFTGAILTFFLSIKDYRIEKIEVLEAFFDEVNELQKQFIKIEFFIPDEPKDLIRNLLVELDANKNAVSCNILLKNNLLETSNEAQDFFKKYLWDKLDDNQKMYFENDKEAYLDKECKYMADKYNKMLEDSLHSFLHFRDISTKELSLKYSKIDFMFVNRTKRKEIYDNIYSKQIKNIQLIKHLLFQLSGYFDSTDKNAAMQIDYLWKVQDYLISEDENFYYRQYLYEIDCAMKELFDYMYNNKDVDQELRNKKRFILKSKPGWEERLHIYE